MAFSAEELERYSRHIILKGVGVKGQKALLSSSVLVVGAGGLGSPAIMYLAASGVGHIGIADFDEVALSNLQRQIIHKTDTVGFAKVLSARAAVKAINPSVKTAIYENGVTPDNIDEIISKYDFIIDGTDSFSAKFLINDACVRNRKPFCYGGIKEFSGQLMTYVPGKSPCLRCIFGDVPPDDGCESCSAVGVIGTLPGIIGSLQALEAQKYIIGAGELLTGQMLIFDGLN
ncbi:MAG: HesA/MoeB/ThiF family protein, partial [Oscillospiraceae bacterium]|nr:HesA/MoeB/ThiF family protein [Oscillospiraceae bacterium]